MKVEAKLRKSVGTFILTDGVKRFGQMRLKGTRSKLTLYDQDFFSAKLEPPNHLHGVLNDLTRVTLIDCVGSNGGSHSRTGERSFRARIFPHFVVFGDFHLDPTKPSITEISFLLEDSEALFYDFHAFDSVIDKELCKKLIERAYDDSSQQGIAPGERPEVLFFSGNYKVLEVETQLGKLAVSHYLRRNMPGPTGGYIRSDIMVSLDFHEGLIFSDAIARLYEIKSFFSLLAGRNQGVLKLNVFVPSNDEFPHTLRVYSSFGAEDFQPSNARSLHTADVLIPLPRESEQFVRVLTKWLERRHTWQAARARFFDCLKSRRVYDVNRLIAAANMFDLAPITLAPEQLRPESDLAQIAEQARRSFQALPRSPERDSILNALGRLWKPSLKRKVRAQSSVLTNEIAEKLAGLDRLTDEAINCRNFFVHGTESTKVDFETEPELVGIFTDVLEFVFALADLTQCGFDVRRWASGFGADHFLTRYLRVHAMFVSELEAAMERKRLQTARPLAQG